MRRFTRVRTPGEPAGPRAVPAAFGPASFPDAGAPAPADPGPEPERSAAGWRALAALPTALPLAVSGYGVAAIGLLLAGAFRPATVLPLGLLAALLAVAAGSRIRRAVPREQRVFDLLMLAFALLDTVGNAHYSAQDVAVTRDPGVYAVTAEWLVHHHSLIIRTHPGIFGSTSVLTWVSAGFGPVALHTRVFAQGSHLLPTLLAAAGWLFGPSHALQLPAVLGGAALLAIYGFGRRLTRPSLAALAAVLVALMLPELAVARDTYTESVDQLLTFGALTLLVEAERSGRARLAALSGLCFGAGVLSRVDGYVTLLAVLATVGLLLAASLPGQRAARARWVAALVSAASVPATMAFFDLSRLSVGYYLGRRPQLIEIGAAAAALVVLLMALVGLSWRGWLRGLNRATERWRAQGAAALTLAGAGLLAARPLFEVGHTAPGDVAIPYVQSLQQMYHLPIDPLRNYSEHTVAWLTWYAGVPAVVLGAFGLAYLATRLTGGRGRSPDLSTLGFALLLGGTGLLYLVRPSIAPDQVWAARRFVPVVLPGLAVTAGVALERLLAAAARSARTVGVRWRAGLRFAPALGAAVLLVPAVATSAPLARAAQYRGELPEIRTLCAALPRRAAVLFTDSFGSEETQTVRSYCGSPAEWLPSPSQSRLAAMQRAAALAHRRLVTVSTVLTGIPLDPVHPPREISALTFAWWLPTLTRAPSQAATTLRVLYLGDVSRAGVIRSLPPRP